VSDESHVVRDVFENIDRDDDVETAGRKRLEWLDVNAAACQAGIDILAADVSRGRAEDIETVTESAPGIQNGSAGHSLCNPFIPPTLAGTATGVDAVVAAIAHAAQGNVFHSVTE